MLFVIILSTDGSLRGPGAQPPTLPPYPKVWTTTPSPYLKVSISHCYLSHVAVSWPCHLSKFYPNMASLYTVFFARNIIIVMITIPTQQVYRVMVILASHLVELGIAKEDIIVGLRSQRGKNWPHPWGDEFSVRGFMLFSQMTCSHNTFALLQWSECLEHANITQSHCPSLSVKNKSIWLTFQ